MVASVTVTQERLGDPPSNAAARARRVGVLGAGTMGAGIAQVAAQAGFDTHLYDIEQRFVDRGEQTIKTSLDRLVARGRMTQDESAAIQARVHPTIRMEDLADSDLIIEAVPERLDLKRDILQQLNDLCPAETLLTSNTSSLSVTELGRESGRPDRVLGLHFFNPPPLMRLIEVVRGEGSSEDAIAEARAVAEKMGKTPVVCRDTPGFIVNRVARPFYLEGMHVFGEGLADVPTVDATARALGFPMGPFQLMDLIGVDVNFAVTISVFEQRFFEPRFRPHPIQQALVRAGRWGRKTGKGFYEYGGDQPMPALPVEARPTRLPPGPWDRWARVAGDADPHVAGRLLSGIVNEAYFALGEGVASAEDIDTAMRLGTNYPKGPLEWSQAIGADLVLETQIALEDWYRDGRHIPAPLLRLAAEGGSR